MTDRLVAPSAGETTRGAPRQGPSQANAVDGPDVPTSKNQPPFPPHPPTSPQQPTSVDSLPIQAPTKASDGHKVCNVTRGSAKSTLEISLLSLCFSLLLVTMIVMNSWRIKGLIPVYLQDAGQAVGMSSSKRVSVSQPAPRSTTRADKADTGSKTRASSQGGASKDSSFSAMGRKTGRRT